MNNRLISVVFLGALGLAACAAARASSALLIQQPSSPLSKTEVHVTVPAEQLRTEVSRILGDGSAFNVESNDEERHLAAKFDQLQVKCGDLQITGMTETDGKSGRVVIASDKPLTISLRATGHGADQNVPPSSTITIDLQSLSATVDRAKGHADVDVPVQVRSSELFIPYTDAKHKKKFGVKTTTRAWAGPKPFSVAITLQLRITPLDDDKGARIEVLGWAPKDGAQVVEIGGWVRLPALLRGFNPDLAGKVQPLDEAKVRVDVGGFTTRTVDNPLVEIMNKVKGKKFEIRP